MIEGCYAAPIVLAMASLAADGKLAVVRITGAMARDTRGRQLVAIEIACVARIALDLCMGVPEWKFRVLVMIEEDRFPLVLVVAPFALGSVPSGMDVLNRVAIDAGSADPLVALADMAGGACDIAMRASQRELGLVVVVGPHLTPCRFAMTVVACFP